MANVFFKKGLLANLPSSYTAGTFYVTTDERAMYLDIDDSTRIRLGDFIQVDAVANLPTDGASTSALYYCVAENILAKWNGATWTQINKQPTAEEMKTLLGLGALAYKSEVVEGDLNADLAAKINAASGAQHTHDNKGVLDGITADKVTAWDSAEQNAKDYADGLNTAMNTRVEALEAIDHEHANKELLDTYTQTEANLADAVAKKHSHTFNETELNKIVEGDVAKWNAVVADHLTSEDKTALENSIKEAKKAGTDANTNIEAYKVTNDARVLAVEEDVAEIVNGENGILAQAKSYSDGKLATARTEISAEIDADVKVVADDLAGYKTSNDAALAGVKATAEAAATKAYTDEELAKKVAKTDYEADKATFATKTELGDVDKKFADYNTTAAQKAIDDAQDAEIAKKVDKVEGKDLIATSEIERLATLANYDDAQVKADIAKKADAETMTTELGKKVDKVEGYSLVSDTEIARLAEVDNYDDTAIKGDIAKKADAETMTTELGKKVDKVEGFSLVSDAEIARLKDVDNYDDAEVRGLIGDNADAIDALAGKVGTVPEGQTVMGIITNIQENAYDDTELRGLVGDNADAIAAEKERAEGIEGGLRTDVDAIKGDYLKGEDKTALEGKITAEETRAKGVEESLQTQINTIMNNPDAEGAINSINEFTKYVEDHGSIAEGMRADINKNKEDIAAEITRATGAEGVLSGRLDVLEAIDHDAYVAADTALKAELNGEIAKKADASTVTAMDEAYKAADAELATAIETAKTEASNQDAVVLAEAQEYADAAKADAIADAAEKYETKGTAQGIVDGLKLAETYEPIGAEGRAIAAAEGKVNALADNVYAKTETYTKEEVEALIAEAHTWGEF